MTCLKKKKQIFFVLSSLPLLFIVLTSNSTAQSSEEYDSRKFFLSGLKGDKFSLQLPAKWKNIEQGLDFQSINLLNQSEEIGVQLRFYRFKPALFDIQVLCSKELGHHGADVKTLAKLSGSAAIINSSYFDIDGHPIAYLKCNGKVVNSRKATHSLYSGVFFVKQGKPFIVHRSKFNPTEVISDAVQVGPRLISKGKNTIGLKNIHAVHHRSGIALDKKGNVIIYVTNSQYSGISWHNLRQILKLKGIDGYEVLNLDGGGSSQMYISLGGFEDYIRGSTRVPTAIAFFRKK